MKDISGWLKFVEAQLTTKVENLISRGKVTHVEPSESTQKLQANLNDGEVKAKIEHFQPYGFTSYPLEGAEPLVLFRNGDRSHGIAVIVNDSRFRPRMLKEGDVVLHHHTDHADRSAENAKARITMTGGKLIIRIDELDIQCGKSRLVMNDEGVILTTPDFQAVKA